MWLKKKEKQKQKQEQKQEPEQEHLINGELPFGWTYRNKDFVEQIQNEYKYFMDCWLEAKIETKEKYGALKSYIMYLEDVEKLCKTKGECFEYWFYEILASPDYIEKRKKELEALQEKLSK